MGAITAELSAAESARVGVSPPPSPPPPSRRWIAILLALQAAIFLYALDMTILATAVPRITSAFGSLAHVPWYGSAFFLTTAPLQSAYGKVYPNFGHQWTFLASIAVFELGNVVSGAASSSPMLIAGRAVSGVGGGGITTGAFTIIASVAPPRRIPLCMGALGVTFGVASAVGPMLGGVLTENLSWRWCFFVNLPVGAVAALAMAFLYRAPPPPPPPSADPLPQPPKTLASKILEIDPVGIVLVVVGSACFLLAMQLASESTVWMQAGVVAGLTVFALCFAAFAAWERWLGDRAMVQGRLLGNALVTGNALLNFLVSAAYYPLLYVLPIYFQAVQGESAAASGIWNFPFILGVSAFVTVANTSMPRVPWHVWAVVGPAVMTAGVACLWTLDLDTSLPKIIGFQLLAGTGIGLVLQVPLTANQSLVAPPDVPTVIGMTLFFETLGSVIFTAVAQASFVYKLVSRVSHSEELANEGITADLVLEAGASGVRTAFPDHVAELLEAYMFGVSTALLIELVCVLAALSVALVVLVLHIRSRQSQNGS
ncbi:MFS general substrate transporter [Xylariomycetidae sp. FL0641]|nr:MFS general substrate transporter [Xylariomycetidae sp. FL0641]